MAYLAIVRRLQLHSPRPILRFSQLVHFLPHPLISPRSRSQFQLLFFAQAFHQTPLKLCKFDVPLSRFHHANGHKIYQIINFEEYRNENHENVQLGLHEILEKFQKAKDFASGDEAMDFLDSSGVKPDKDFVFSMIWGLREEWKLAFLVYKWGEKWDCVGEKTWCLVIWLLGNHKKFSTAWTLIHELHRASKDTQQAMLIMIDRYVAANCVDKAIQTFHMMQKFKFSPDQSTYFTFLNILCKHGNIEEAEEFMFLNKKFFPLETECFNIILNGWCNIAIDITEAKRIWREMSKCCIEPDGISYTHLISCYSSVGNLFESLRLYDEMKKRNWTPGVDVYHSLILVLTRENCLNEALKIVDRMKETGMEPNSTTYNLIVCPLCEAGKYEEARNILARMIENGISPTIDTFHALLEGESLQGTLGVFNHMKNAGLGPRRETFLFTLEKFLRLDQHENALKIWSEMEQYAVNPDRKHYSILVQGLAKCGLMVKARELYSEMISVGISDDPLLKKVFEESGKDGVKTRKSEGEMTVVRYVKKGKGLKCGSDRVVKGSRRHGEQREKKRASGN